MKTRNAAPTGVGGGTNWPWNYWLLSSQTVNKTYHKLLTSKIFRSYPVSAELYRTICPGGNSARRLGTAWTPRREQVVAGRVKSTILVTTRGDRIFRRRPAWTRGPQSVDRPATPWPTRPVPSSWVLGRWGYGPCWCSRCPLASQWRPPPDHRSATACVRVPSAPIHQSINPSIYQLIKRSLNDTTVQNRDNVDCAQT